MKPTSEVVFSSSFLDLYFWLDVSGRLFTMCPGCWVMAHMRQRQSTVVHWIHFSIKPSGAPYLYFLLPTLHYFGLLTNIKERKGLKRHLFLMITNWKLSGQLFLPW